MMFIDADSGEECLDVEVLLTEEELDEVLSMFREACKNPASFHDGKRAFTTGDGIWEKERTILILENKDDKVLDLARLRSVISGN